MAPCVSLNRPPRWPSQRCSRSIHYIIVCFGVCERGLVRASRALCVYLQTFALSLMCLMIVMCDVYDDMMMSRWLSSLLDFVVGRHAIDYPYARVYKIGQFGRPRCRDDVECGWQPKARGGTDAFHMRRRIHLKWLDKWPRRTARHLARFVSETYLLMRGCTTNCLNGHDTRRVCACLYVWARKLARALCCFELGFTHTNTHTVEWRIR